MEIDSLSSGVFFFNDTATTEIYTLSLHDALPIWIPSWYTIIHPAEAARIWQASRSEEHTSELQSLRHLVCRLLLEKKKKPKNITHGITVMTHKINACGADHHD